MRPVLLFLSLLAVLVSVLMAKIEAEVRFRLRAGNLDWNFSSRTVLAEEWIDRFQQNRFPPRDHMRECRVEPRLAVKIEYVSIEAVRTREIHLGTRNAIVKL